MSSKSYDVVLMPDSGLIEKTIALSEKLEVLGSLFTLDNKNFFPHISLYMLKVDDNMLIQAIDLLTSISKESKTVDLIAKEYHYENDYVDVEYIKSQELISLQEKVIEALNPIRDGLRENDTARLPTATGETLFNLTKFGYRSIGNLFNPHITFTRFKNIQNEILKSFPEKELFNGTSNTIGIFEMGDNGTCVKKIGTWQFPTAKPK